MNLTAFINHHTDSIYADDPVLVFSPVLGNTMLVKILRGSWHQANYVFPRLFNFYVEKPVVKGMGFISGNKWTILLPNSHISMPVGLGKSIMILITLTVGKIKC